MKNRVLSILVVSLLISATALWASDIVGKWFARVPGSRETVLERFQSRTGQTVFTFRVDGTELLGTVSTPQGDDTPISDGKINGDQISFVIVRRVNGTEMRTVYKGIVAGDGIKFTQEIQGESQPQEFVATREFHRDGDIPLKKSLIK